LHLAHLSRAIGRAIPFREGKKEKDLPMGLRRMGKNLDNVFYPIFLE
jgi:hypothetical protein